MPLDPCPAATTTVQSGSLLATTAAWHLMTVRASALAGSTAGVGPALSHMWLASRLLMAVSQAQASDAPNFQLPDHLG